VFSPDFQEFLQALNDNGAEFVVVGGYAVNKRSPRQASGYSRPEVAISRKRTGSSLVRERARRASQNVPEEIHYGHVVRATGDLDLFVNATLENSGRVLAALNDFGWSDPALEPDYFAQPGNMYIMGHPPVRIDLITRIDGLDFETVYRDRVVDVVDGLSLGFVSLEHLRTNKLASGRNKDLGDIDALFEN
jgi:hypothetical protein